MNKKLIIFSTLFFSVFFIISCGGDNSNDNKFIGAAIVSVETSPKKFDTGDRTKVKVQISDLHPNGISLKINIPSNLEYVNGTGVIKIKDQSFPLSPQSIVNSNQGLFLVFYMNNSIFDNHTGELFFELEAINPLEYGLIAVDADVDDPAIDNSVEFSSLNPEFIAEDSVEIEVIG